MKMTMACAWILCSCFFVALVPPSSQYALPAPRLDAVERYLYVQLEDALSSDGATLEQLREVLFQKPRPTTIRFHINITADSLPAKSCSSCSWCEKAFSDCPFNEEASRYGNSSTAQLCSNLSMTWMTDVNVVELIEVLTHTVVPWCAHGPSIFVQTGPGANMFLDYLVPEEIGLCDVGEPIKLHIDLDCQPWRKELTSAVGEFFTWVSVT